MFKLTSFKSGTILYDFDLDKRKLLVGSSEKCDIVINDPSISHYHAFITLTEDGGEIIDLSSENGIFINHSKTQKGFFSHGDTLSFGAVEFHVGEDAEQNLQIVDQDSGKVQKLSKEFIIQSMPELPPADDLVVIDGEYCDIVFKEDNYENPKEIKAFTDFFNKNDYIDTHEKADLVPFLRKNESRSIQVTVMSMGNIISVDYLPVKSTTYFVSSQQHNKKTVLINTLNSHDNLPFLKISNDEVQLYKLAGHNGYNLTTSQVITASDNAPIQFKDGEQIAFTHKTVEVHLQFVDTPPHIRSTPFFGRDRYSKVQTAKVFSALMSVFLLLLLVDTKMPEEEKKKVAVIYRVAKKSKDSQKLKVAEKTAEINKDNGIKKDKQPNPDNKNRFAKKNVEKPKQQKQSQVAQKAASQPKKVAAAAAKPVKTQAKKMKAYQFNMKSSFSSVFASNNNADTKVNRAPSSVSSNSLSAAKASTSDLKATASASNSNFGMDYKGGYDRSTGSKGLSNKRGIDTTFIEPKTVVLGSMDPELLRRILQEYLPQFRHCYQQELESVSEDLEGVIDLKFRIGQNGSVSKINVKPKDAKFTQKGTNCMASVLKLIKFPKPKGGGVVDVKQPLNFFSDKHKI